MIGWGLARYGFKHAAATLLSSIFDLSLQAEFYRLPELVCGFNRQDGIGPTLYPVACSPQAWSAGALFLLLEACLGIQIDAPREKIQFLNPVLPPFLNELQITNLEMGVRSIDVHIRQDRGDVSINVREKRGDAEVTIKKSKTNDLRGVGVPAD